MRKILAGLSLILMLLLSACASTQVSTGNEVPSSYKIGVMAPLTGDAASVGIPIMAAIKIGIEEINANGGINGVMLEPIYEDGKCNPKDGNTAAQKLVNVDKVKVIIGGVCSGETLGASPITESAKVILISASATSPDITNAGDFVFRVAPSDAYAGSVAAQFALNEMSAKTAAVISESTDYAQGLARVFSDEFSKSAKMVATEVYNTEDTDFRSQITKIKSAKPDVIYIVPQTPAKGILLLKQLKEAGVSSKLLTSEVLIGRNVISENAKEMEGIIGIEQKFDETNPKAAKLFSVYRQQTGEEPAFPGYMAGGYDAAYIISDAIAKQGYDSEKIRDYLYSLKDYDGAVGKITIDQNGDPLSAYSKIEVKNGKAVVLG